MKEHSIEKGENYNINGDELVKVTQYESTNDIKIQDTKYKNKSLTNFKRLNRKQYLNKKTGEIKYYKIGEQDREENLKRAMKNLKEILRNNFNGGKNELFITLTTKEVITDLDKIIGMFKQFWRKMNEIYKTLAYVFVVEKQEIRNSWHIHMLIKDRKR
jgi:hypothetical protein